MNIILLASQKLLDRNAITVDNIVDFNVNSDTIFTSGEYSPDPTDANADKSWWEVNWKKALQWIAFAVAVVATINSNNNKSSGRLIDGICLSKSGIKRTAYRRAS